MIIPDRAKPVESFKAERTIITHNDKNSIRAGNPSSANISK